MIGMYYSAFGSYLLDWQVILQLKATGWLAVLFALSIKAGQSPRRRQQNTTKQMHSDET